MTTPEAPGARLLYTATLDGFGEVVVREVVPAHDAALLHTWVNADRARFWGMGGADLARVEEVYGYVDSLPSHHAYLAFLDGRPAALFQTYEPENDPLGEVYPVRDGDVGVHLLIGPPEGSPRPGFTGALFGSFLDHLWRDPRHLRIVAEPDVRNQASVDRFVRSGFVLGDVVALGDKQAQLVFSERADRPTGAPSA